MTPDPCTPPRPRWVEVGDGEFAILIKVVGTAALIRWPEARGGYAWRDVSRLRRRRDLDGRPEPAWLQQARVSRRPNAALYWLLGLAPAPPDTLVDSTLPVADGPPVPMFETDRDGRPL